MEDFDEGANCECSRVICLYSLSSHRDGGYNSSRIFYLYIVATTIEYTR
jgi:hypothetical protein